MWMNQARALAQLALAPAAGDWLGAHYLIAPWFEMLLLATAFMLGVLGFMRVAGFPGRCRTARRHMVAAACELWLNRSSPGQILKSEIRLILANLRLLVWLTPSIVFGSILFACLYSTLEERFGHAPILPGSEFVVRVEAAAGGAAVVDLPELLVQPELTPVTAQVRPEGAGIEWFRLEARKRGQAELTFAPTGEQAQVASPMHARVNVGMDALPSAPRQRAGDWLVRIDYPASCWFGHTWGWLACFLVLCLATAVPLAKWTGVRL